MCSTLLLHVQCHGEPSSCTGSTICAPPSASPVLCQPLLLHWPQHRAETFCCLCRNMAKRIWVLSFVLAPYTHLLAQTTHIPQSKKLIDRIIPPLLERYPIHAHLGHTGSSALPEEASAHKAHLCAQCQAAAQQRSAAHSKRGLSGKGGPKQAAPTELQADSSAASLQQSHAADTADESGFTLPGMLVC